MSSQVLGSEAVSSLAGGQAAWQGAVNSVAGSSRAVSVQATGSKHSGRGTEGGARSS